MEIERIGPYVIDHKIGSGGMGTVYLAQHAETGEDAAVKVLPPELAREEGFVARFEREIEALQKLTNPHIVKLLDTGIEANTYYYAMEYVEGETLTDRLRREKRLSWRDVVGYSLQICSALKSAHNAGIVHRDLKPSNLLLDKDNNVKLTDFGVAQVFAGGRLTMQGGIIGTAEYMSPEQAHGRRATKKSDLYSLGAVMYTMLTGRPPFVEKSTLEVIQKHKYGTFDRPSRYVEGIPRRLEETVCQLLEKDPEKRFPDALVLSRRLEEIRRRADIANQEETRVAEMGSTGNGPQATVRVDDDAADPLDGVGGTLVRDLVRADIEQSMEPSSLSKVFNNTWVLLGMFLLLIGGGVVWFRMIEKRAEAETDSTARKQEMALLLKTRTLLETTLRTHPPNKTDPFLRRAIQAIHLGDVDRAERLLMSTQYVADNPEKADPFQEKLAKAIDQIREIQTLRQEVDKKTQAPQEIARQLLDRAEELYQEGKTDEAKKIWRAILDVYGQDPRCREQATEAKRRLRESGRKRHSEFKAVSRAYPAIGFPPSLAVSHPF